MPIISTHKEKDSPEVVSTGTAVFKDGKLVCDLNEDETSALNFLCNNARKGAVDFSFDGVSAAVSIIKSNIKRQVNYISENPQFSVNIKIEADIAEIDSDTGYNSAENQVNTIKACAEEKIKSDIEALCRKLYLEEKADAAGLSRLVYIYYPEKFREQEKNLSEIMANSQYSVEVQIKIRRIGQDYSS